MARGCTIPCDIGGVERRIRSPALQDTLGTQAPTLGLAVLLLLASPALIPLADWRLAVVAAVLVALAAAVVLVLIASLRLPSGIGATAAGRLLADHRADVAAIGFATALAVLVALVLVLGLPSA